MRRDEIWFLPSNLQSERSGRKKHEISLGFVVRSRIRNSGAFCNHKQSLPLFHSSLFTILFCCYIHLLPHQAFALSAITFFMMHFLITLLHHQIDSLLQHPPSPHALHIIHYNHINIFLLLFDLYWPNAIAFLIIIRTTSNNQIFKNQTTAPLLNKK